MEIALEIQRWYLKASQLNDPTVLLWPPNLACVCMVVHFDALSLCSALPQTQEALTIGEHVFNKSPLQVRVQMSMVFV